MRKQTLHALASGITQIEVIFLQSRFAYHFPRLFLVSPSSSYPFLKCQADVVFLRDLFVAQAARIALVASDLRNEAWLFGTGRALFRDVIDLHEVIPYLHMLDSDIVELEGLSSLEQVRTFRKRRLSSA